MVLDQLTVLLSVEAGLRIIVGLRFLSSGASNVRRWPNAAQTAGLVFPWGAYFFGLMATVLMVLGGVGVALGFQTAIAAVMLIIFLIPTFRVHQYWLRKLPGMLLTVRQALNHEEAKTHFRILERQVINSHQTGVQNNIVLLAAALYFAVRGSVAFGVDNLMGDWVIRLF